MNKRLVRRLSRLLTKAARGGGWSIRPTRSQRSEPRLDGGRWADSALLVIKAQEALLLLLRLLLLGRRPSLDHRPVRADGDGLALGRLWRGRTWGSLDRYRGGLRIRRRVAVDGWEALGCDKVVGARSANVTCIGRDRRHCDDVGMQSNAPFRRSSSISSSVRCFPFLSTTTCGASSPPSPHPKSSSPSRHSCSSRSSLVCRPSRPGRAALPSDAPYGSFDPGGGAPAS